MPETAVGAGMTVRRHALAYRLTCPATTPGRPAIRSAGKIADANIGPIENPDYSNLGGLVVGADGQRLAAANL